METEIKADKKYNIGDKFVFVNFTTFEKNIINNSSLIKDNLSTRIILNKRKDLYTSHHLVEFPDQTRKVIEEINESRIEEKYKSIGGLSFEAAQYEIKSALDIIKNPENKVLETVESFREEFLIEELPNSYGLKLGIREWIIDPTYDQYEHYYSEWVSEERYDNLIKIRELNIKKYEITPKPQKNFINKLISKLF